MSEIKCPLESGDEWSPVNHLAARWVIEKGFKVIHRQTECSSPNWQELLFRSNAAQLSPYQHPAGHFWLRFSAARGDDLEHYERAHVTRVEIGDVDALPTERGFQFVTSAGVEICNYRGTLEFQASNFRRLPLVLRQCVARGWFWMGAPLEQALEKTKLDPPTAHLRQEWELDRRDDWKEFWEMEAKKKERRL